MALQVDDVLETMIAAAKASLIHDWTANEPAVRQQLEDLATQLANLSAKKDAGQLTQTKLAFYFDLEKQARISVMAEIQGIGKAAAENAINAALHAVSGIINGAVGFALI